MDPSHAAPDEQYSDFNFWRMPPNREVPSTDPGDDAQFNDFYFWRPPPPPCLNDTEMDCSSPVQPRPASPGGHGTPPPMDMPESGSSRPTRREWLEVEEDDAMDDDDDEHPMSAAELLSGGAGARLVGLLGQLTQHLGSSSRFSRAAGLLQQDMLRQRELVQQTNAARIAPLEGSTLQQPEVLSSVGSLLSVLQQTDTHVQTLATPLSAARAGAPLQLFVDGVDAAMPPPSPASPEALATLAPPTSRFALDAVRPRRPHAYSVTRILFEHDVAQLDANRMIASRAHVPVAVRTCMCARARTYNCMPTVVCLCTAVHELHDLPRGPGRPGRRAADAVRKAARLPPRVPAQVDGGA